MRTEGHFKIAHDKFNERTRRGGVQKKKKTSKAGTDRPSENCKVNPLKMMQYV